MASQLNRDFFKKAKKVDRAIEIKDNEAVIPAVKERAEVRVRLPNRRLLTIEEREAILKIRKEKIAELEGRIESERKILLAAVKEFEITRVGGPEVISQNHKVKLLMEERSKLYRPEMWIEGLSDLTFKDVFASKKDIRKIGADVFQIKRRVEPITSLYYDLDLAAANASAPEAQGQGQGQGQGQSLAQEQSQVQEVEQGSEEAKTGAIIGQVKRVKKIKKTLEGPAGPLSFI
jgi:hypothetical protein